MTFSQTRNNGKGLKAVKRGWHLMYDQPQTLRKECRCNIRSAFIKNIPAIFTGIFFYLIDMI